MVRLLALGILAAAFFSSTFILNRAMSLDGGHWVWAASLRFGYMLLFLSVWILLTKGVKQLAEIRDVYLRHWQFWTIAGSIGFGLFYALLCYSASFAAGWIVATTWQMTILATPVVLAFFGRRVPARGLLFTALIFLGILLVNLESASSTPLRQVLLCALPVLIAAFAYPVGNQLAWEAAQGGHRLIPDISHPVVKDALARVLLLTLGSLPFWLLLVLVVAPPPPSPGQLMSTALVALFSGVIATTIFLHARHLCVRPGEIAAVDATQSMEVVFSLLGEIIFLHGALPGTTATAGIALTVFGLVAYTRMQTAP